MAQRSEARIDAHQHFWRYSPETHAWIDGGMAALKRDFLPPDLEPLLRASGFDGCVAVQAQQDPAETAWLLSLAEAHPFVRGVVGWVDLRSAEVERELERAAAHPRLRGVRHIVQSEPDGFMSGVAFRRGIAALERHELAYDVLIYERQLAEAVELVRAFPRQRFVVDHIAKPDIRAHWSGAATMDAWRDGMRALAAHDNVWCKLSGMVTEGDWSSWSPADFEPYLDVVLDAFGPDRCMIGSDWPVCTLADTYGEVTGIVTSYAERLSDSDREQILGRTATAFYAV
ncbi:MAG: amidohydrolase family protein [Chloroflexi bacterium]|nr:amidohydrolase family protein [Chloroflexota bacterium]